MEMEWRKWIIKIVKSKGEVDVFGKYAGFSFLLLWRCYCRCKAWALVVSSYIGPKGHQITLEVDSLSENFFLFLYPLHSFI
jgi:hypothetical protein